MKHNRKSATLSLSAVVCLAFVGTASAEGRDTTVRIENAKDVKAAEAPAAATAKPAAAEAQAKTKAPAAPAKADAPAMAEKSAAPAKAPAETAPAKAKAPAKPADAPAAAAKTDAKAPAAPAQAAAPKSPAPAAAPVAASPFKGTPCEEVKTMIDGRLKAKGVTSYSLDVVAKEDAKDGKVVGSCEAGTKKIVYNRN